MLVLTRKVDETIRIGDNVRVTVVEIRTHSGKKVRIGVDAPADVPICRGELVSDPSDAYTRSERRLVDALHDFFKNGPEDSMAALSAIVARVAAELEHGEKSDERSTGSES